MILNRAYKKPDGFTLLELLVVITLMGLVAVTATAMIDGLTQQETTDIPYESTKTRLERIRHAIIGDLTHTVNGSPHVSGYVVDMGRLPANIHELIEKGTQPAWASVELSEVEPTVQIIGKVWGGWRGPYLAATAEGPNRVFRDGWGNRSVIDDELNFGWNVSHNPVVAPVCTVGSVCTDIAIQSLGADGLSVASSNIYDADYPATGLNLVNQNEWQQTSTLVFDISFNKPPSTPPVNGLDLRIYNFEDGAVSPVTKTADLVVMRSSNPAADGTLVSPVTFDLDASSVNPISVTITDIFPTGRYAAVVVCSTTSPRVVYDGNCDATVDKQPYYFTLLPSASKVTIPWNIP